MATIHDVAKLAGVSTATVSRSFTTSHPLSAETRKRVLQVAEQLNYRPRGSRSAHFRFASQQQMSHRASVAGATVGFQFFASSESDTLPMNGFYGPVLAGAQAEADALGMHLLLHTTYRHKLTQELPQMVREQAVAGMLLVGTADPEILQLFLQYVPHVVLVDNRDVPQQHDCILSDGFGGAFTATQHLLKLGHRRIGFLTCQAPEVTLEDRFHGYLCALHHAGIPVNPDHIAVAGPSEPGCDELVSTGDVMDFLRRPDRPTAIVAANDAHALTLMQACRRLGISIPGQLSVVGFDDIDFSAHAYPALSTIRVEKEQLGRLAVRRLHLRLQKGEPSAKHELPVVIQLPVSLVERESCAPLHRSGE